MEKKRKGRGWLLILVIVLLLFYRHNAADRREAERGAESGSVTQAHGSRRSSPTPTPTPAAPATEAPRSPYPPFIPAGALVIDGSEETREYDWLVKQAFEEQVPDFWLKNHRFYGTMDFKELDCSCFWVKTMAHSDFTHKNEDGSEDTYQHLFFTYYDYSAADIERMKGEMARAADEILSCIPAGADKWLIVKTIHDRLCATVTYDHSLSKPHIYDAYGALVLHEAVCAGYAGAFNYLLGLANVGSESSYSDSHAWTHVWLWSPESYVDATWDDPDLTDRYGRPYIKYDYFLISYDELRRVDAHSFISEEREYYDSNYGETPLSNNYFSHEGYLLYSCDRNAIVSAFKRQFSQPGANYLTVRFYNESDYLTVIRWDSDTLGRIIGDSGYYGEYYIWTNDTLRTIGIGLYA